MKIGNTEITQVIHIQLLSKVTKFYEKHEVSSSHENYTYSNLENSKLLLVVKPVTIFCICKKNVVFTLQGLLCCIAYQAVLKPFLLANNKQGKNIFTWRGFSTM